jgi:hypothetical protein
MNKSSCLLMLSFSSLAILPVNAVGDTYKCRAPNGKISYVNQMPMTPGIKCEQMFVRKPPITKGEDQVPAPAPASEQAAAASSPDKTAAPAEAAPSVQKTQADKELEDKRKKADAESEKKKAQQTAEGKQAEQKLKEENCKHAQSNLATYKMGRVRKVDAKGEYYYLDDEETKQGLAQAEKEVAANCN